MTLLRRFSTLVAFAFWQGGFAFYAGIVVPIGTDVLGSATAQGIITRQVSYWMNVAGSVAIPIMIWDALATNRFRISRTAMAALMAAGLVALFFLHGKLDALLDVSAKRVIDRKEFTPMHRQYLWISTAHFACGIAFLMLTPWAWQQADAHSGKSERG